MRYDCLRIAELNQKINSFSDSNIITFSPERQKELEQEKNKLCIMLNMKYPKLITDLVVAKINTKGIKKSTDISVIQKIIIESNQKQNKKF